MARPEGAPKETRSVEERLEQGFVDNALRLGMSETRNGNLRTLRRRAAMHLAGLVVFALAGGLVGLAVNDGSSSVPEQPPGLIHPANGARGPAGAGENFTFLLKK